MGEWKKRGHARGCDLKYDGLSSLALEVCLARGMDSVDKIDHFLNPKLSLLKSPWTIRGMREAVELVANLKSSHRAIRVFADYDVDGTCGAALLGWVFREFGITHDIRQPDRFRDGYGLNVEAVVQAKSDGVGALVTVDCGITSFEAAEKAQSLGLPLIVLDHHQVDAGRGLPIAHAIVNPHQSECLSGLKELCGAGLAFYFAMALRNFGRENHWWPDGKFPELKKHLDLVTLATAADMVPLTGDNHILVRHGMQVLKETSKPGLWALLESAGLTSRDIQPSHLGFVLGPRINACGRVGNASLALGCLLAQDFAEAQQAAVQIETANSQRMQLQDYATACALELAFEGVKSGRFTHGVVLGDFDWHEGVVGIVASKVAEAVGLPTVIMSWDRELNTAKGSVRSARHKDVLSGLRHCRDLLLTFGGHHHAAGLKLSLDMWNTFEARWNEAMQLQGEGKAAELVYDLECELEDFRPEVIADLAKMGPFGVGNPEPVFVVKGEARSLRVLKEKHLKFELAGLRTRINAIWFQAKHSEERLKTQIELGATNRWAVVPEINRFQGRASVVTRIKDFQEL